ncbi:MAG: TonB-dependent receptor plug domain-containing protein, partial [Planctomycetota bacterium]
MLEIDSSQSFGLSICPSFHSSILSFFQPSFFRHMLLILVLCFSIVSAQDTVEEFTLGDSIVVFGEREKPLPSFNTIAAKIPISLRRTPASVSIIRQTLLKDQQGVVLGDALRNVSGINSHTGFGVFDYFTVRGFNSLENGLILTDGTAEPEISFYNLYNVERVEVLKGPGSFLYGGNPLSGTINMVRKRPVFSTFARFSITYGYFNSYRNVIDVGTADLKQSLAARLTALWQGSDGYRNGKESQVLAVNPTFT